MLKTLCMLVLLVVCSLAISGQGQMSSPQAGLQKESLCVLKKNLGAGEHEAVRVSGIYGPGVDHSVLEDPACSTEGTWVELDLKSSNNEQKLRELLSSSRQVYVSFEGELYGPPLADPKLPEAIKKAYQPGWGHLSAFKTKLVVHVICEVKSMPSSPVP